MKIGISKELRKICMVILLCILFGMLASSCQHISTIEGLENGFKILNSSDETSIFHCAYKSDQTEFEIDNVTLDFYYGGWYYMGPEYHKENICNMPYFELYFADRNGKNFLVKRVEENFISEKYQCKIVSDDKGNILELKYNHFETITIPKEIFSEESGKIWFEIYSENVNEVFPTRKHITGICIFYKIINGKVILSNQQL